ncbi:MAG: hypothetical protein PUK73_01920 [Spirochaetota bacterium]|uniref:hypothetical protein n=1 Tax=Candidatus Avelusimicrobium faecicola TaxID=3416205 RepID=UPI002A6389AF|nr:hypothetical protein [Spirochaetota bacterium]
MKKIITLVCLLALISLPAYAKKDAAWVVKKAKAEDDSFAKQKTVTFPEINYRQMGGEVKEYTGVSVWKSPAFKYKIVAIEKDGQPLEFKIEVADARANLAGNKNFNNYSKALDKDGSTLKFISGVQFDPEQGDALKHPLKEEHFSIVLDKAYLVSHRETGIVIKVYGESESPVFHISPWYVDGVLKYFEGAK